MKKKRVQRIRNNRRQTQTDQVLFVRRHCLSHKLGLPSRIEMAEKKEGSDLYRVNITAYTGKPVNLSDYGIDHPVVYNTAGIKFKDKVPYLLNHYQPIGHIENIQLINGELHAEGVHSFPSTASDEVAKAVENSFPMQSSMGLDIEESDVTFVEEGVVSVNNQTFSAPIYVVNKSVLVEQTATMFGRDDDTKITKLSKDVLMRIKNAKTPKYTPEPIKNEVPDPIKEPVKDEEHPNVTAINNTLNSFAIIKLSRLVKDDDAEAMKILENGIKSNWDEARITDAIKLHQLEKDYPPVPSPGKNKDKDVIQNSFLARLAISLDVSPEHLETKLDKKVVDNAFDKGPMSLREMLTIVANSNGGKFTGHSDIEDACKYIKRLHNNVNYSTIVFPNLLERVTQFRMEEYWKVAEPWAPKYLLSQSQSSFKPTGRTRPSGGQIWKELDEDGRIQLGSFGEETTYLTYLRTIAQMLVFKRETIINDDLDVIEEMMSMMVEGATIAPDFMFVNKLYAGIASGFLKDGVNALFGAGATFSDTALQTAYDLVRNQTITKGDLTVKQQFQTKWLLVHGRALERDVWDLIYNTKIVSGTADLVGSKSYWEGKVTPVLFENLDNTTYSSLAETGAWGLIPATPRLAPYSITYLNNKKKPTTETVDLPADMLGMGIRGYWDLEVNEREPEAVVWNFPAKAAP